MISEKEVIQWNNTNTIQKRVTFMMLCKKTKKNLTQIGQKFLIIPT